MRLIDADNLITKFDERADWGVCQIINREPTVDVLDKIRAEIEQLYTVDTVYEDVVAVDKADVLKIIDKYKGDKA